MSRQPRRTSTERAGNPARTSARAQARDNRGLKIGEAADLLGVKPYVLRFWETEFPDLRPTQTESRHRYYSPDDIELLKQIKHLLHQERFTIEGARRRLAELKEGGNAATAPDPNAVPSAPAASTETGNRANFLGELRKELSAIHEMLKD